MHSSQSHLFGSLVRHSKKRRVSRSSKKIWARALSTNLFSNFCAFSFIQYVFFQQFRNVSSMSELKRTFCNDSRLTCACVCIALNSIRPLSKRSIKHQRTSELIVPTSPVLKKRKKEKRRRRDAVTFVSTLHVNGFGNAKQHPRMRQSPACTTKRRALHPSQS